jgi:A/G-specific adenine glycosylase
LLEKRPPTGIWGGLWSLPEAAADQDMPTLLRARYGLVSATERELPKLVHTFTHFRLHIRPRVLSGIPAQPAAREPGLMWISVEEALGAALPAPIRKLLAQVQE